MKFNVSIIDGKVSVTDAATNQPLDWIDTVDLVASPGSVPILYIGTTHITAAFSVGPTSVAATPPIPAPAPTA